MAISENGHKGAGDVMRARLLAREVSEAEIVDVIPEEGFVYKFRKPSKIGLLFGAGQLPQSMASEAIAAWNKDGTIQTDKLSPEMKLKAAEKAYNIRDRVIAHSVSPKLVIGSTDNPDEISADDVPEAHLEYFFMWMAAGGDAGLMLGNFPSGQQSNAVAGSNRKERRTAAKRARRVK